MEDNNDNKLALIKASELSLVDNNVMNAKQLAFILKRTPKQYIEQRPAKGGGVWDFVSGGYVKKVLNLAFGFNWDFEILDEKILIEFKEVIVTGKLTVRSNENTIVKTQYGNKDIVFRLEPDFNEDGTPKMIEKYNKFKKINELVQATKQSNIPLSIGNDLKSAATDALKKCASELGIAADIYNSKGFKEVLVDTTIDITISDEQWVLIKKDFDNKVDPIPNEQIDYALNIINNRLSDKYQLLVDFLSKIK